MRVSMCLKLIWNIPKFQSSLTFLLSLWIISFTPSTAPLLCNTHPKESSNFLTLPATVFIIEQKPLGWSPKQCISFVLLKIISLQLTIHFLETKDKIQQCSWANTGPKNQAIQHSACSINGQDTVTCSSYKLQKAVTQIYVLTLRKQL